MSYGPAREVFRMLDKTVRRTLYRQDVKELLVRRISEKQGCKGAEVLALSEAAAVMSRHRCDIVELLEELVQEGRLVEVEYALPSMDYKPKKFYLPSGSRIRVQNA